MHTMAAIFVSAAAVFPQFKDHVIDAEAGIGLAITVADVNSDGRPDIIGASAERVCWYENPSWTKHLMVDTVRGSNVCIAPYDLDRDRTMEFALGADWQFNNTASGGALYLLRSDGEVTRPWRVIPLLEKEPTLHRIRWADVEGDGTPELVVAPLKGRLSTPPYHLENPARLFLLRPGPNPFEAPWTEEIIDQSLHLVHNVWPESFDRGMAHGVLAASLEGISFFARAADGGWKREQLTQSIRTEEQVIGAGEVKSVRWREAADDGFNPWLLASIEPWHGTMAVVYVQRPDGSGWVRHVVDDALAGGHAVWWADFDGDHRQDLLVGFRDKAGPRNVPGLNVYQLEIGPGAEDLKAQRHIIDDGGMATEDALAADLNGDGRPDIVAFGRATGNIKYYENLGAP